MDGQGDHTAVGTQTNGIRPRSKFSTRKLKGAVAVASGVGAFGGIMGVAAAYSHIEYLIGGHASFACVPPGTANGATNRAASAAVVSVDASARCHGSTANIAGTVRTWMSYTGGGLIDSAAGTGHETTTGYHFGDVIHINTGASLRTSPTYNHYWHWTGASSQWSG